MSKLQMYERWVLILKGLESTEGSEVAGSTLKDLCDLTSNALERPDELIPFEKAFHDLLNSNPPLRNTLRMKLINEAIQHVDETMDHYKTIKAQRPFTDEEKEVGKALLNLMGAAQRLLHPK